MYSVPSLYYFWLVAIFVLAGVGIYWQYRQFLKAKEEGGVSGSSSAGNEGDYVDLNDPKENRDNKYLQLEKEIYSTDMFNLSKENLFGSNNNNDSGAVVINEKKHVQMQEISRRKQKIIDMENDNKFFNSSAF